MTSRWSFRAQPSSGVYLLLLFLVLAAPAAFLFFSPKLPDSMEEETCQLNVRLPLNQQVNLNCDSFELMRLSKNPSLLFEPKNVRQSRPGFIFMAYALRQPLDWLSRPLLETASGEIGVPREGVDAGKVRSNVKAYLPDYLAYLLLNVALLLSSCVIFVRTIDDAPALSVPLLIILSFLVFNDLVKAFFFSPHLQLFNILIPLLCVHLGLRGSRGDFFSTRFLIAASLLCGVLLLAYSSAALLLPALLVSGLILAVGSKHSFKKLIGYSVASGCLFFLPSALWYWLVLSKTGSFYVHEVEDDHRVVWIFESFRRGDLGARLAEALQEFGRMVVVESAGAGLLLLGILVIAVLGGSRASGALRRNAGALSWCLGVAIIFFLFYLLAGLYLPRLAYASVPSLLLACGILARDAQPRISALGNRFLLVALSAIAVTLHLRTILKAGPWG